MQSNGLTRMGAIAAILVGASGCAVVEQEDTVGESELAATIDDDGTEPHAFGPRIPTAFAIDGTCGLRSPCHLVTTGDDEFELVCRGRSYAGSLRGRDVTFAVSDDLSCTGRVQRNRIVGECTDGAGATCDFVTDTDPDPVPFCATLDGDFRDVSVCGESYAGCDVIQDGCRFQASCDDASRIVYGSVDGADLSLFYRTDDGSRFIGCSGPIVDDEVTGECAQRWPRDDPDPVVCDGLQASVPTRTHGTCAETLPDDGFVLAGCGLDGMWFTAQQDCLWQVFGKSGVLSGVAPWHNLYFFHSPQGQWCHGTVAGGEFKGLCIGRGGACWFDTVEPSPDPGVFQLPAAVTSSGCGPSLACKTVQDGDLFAAGCGAGIVYEGTVDSLGVEFDGLNGYACYADLNSDGSALFGECTRVNDDGSVSTCRDLTAQQGARLVISW